MSDEKDVNLQTPKNTRPRPRRLGLGRVGSSSSLTKQVTKEILPADLGASATATPSSATQSDVRVSYKGLEYQQAPLNARSFSTPLSAIGSASTPLAAAQSTKCRPYRLSLSKRVREKLSKKRLKFHLAHGDESPTGSISAQTSTIPTHAVNDCDRQLDIAAIKYDDCRDLGIADCVAVNSQSKRIDTREIESDLQQMDVAVANIANVEQLDRGQLIAEIKKAHAKLEMQKKHERKVQELKDAIAVWEQGFKAVLNDLQQELQPPKSKSDILDQLSIPLEMLKLAEEE